jgi:hypothetical protein
METEMETEKEADAGNWRTTLRLTAMLLQPLLFSLSASPSAERRRGRIPRLDQDCHNALPSVCHFPAKSCFLSFSRPRK